MTTLRQLRIAHGAGDPDPCLALRIDVVAAAERLATALEAPSTIWHVYSAGIDEAPEHLHLAVKRLRRARAKRGVA